MTKFQINYYNSLSLEDQYILKVSALKAYSLSLYDISILVQLRRAISQTQIKACMYEAIHNKLFIQSSYNKNEWYVTPEFMIFIYPKLTDYAAEWNKINDSYNLFGYSYYRDDSFLKNFRNCLYSLLHNQKEYQKEESRFYLSYPDKAIECYSDFI